MKKHWDKVVLILLLICLGFFCFLGDSFAINSDTIVINEIMIGQTDNTKNEFIELYNNSEQDIDLTGYSLKKKTESKTESNLVSSSKFIGTIPKHGYFLISHPDYKNVINADLVYSGSSYSIADNNTVLLYNQNRILIDKVGYGKAGDFESQPAPTPGNNNKSIERKPIGYDSDNNNTDFIIQDIPTPQNSSTTVDSGDGDEQNEEVATSTPVTTPTTTPTSATIPIPISYSLGDVVINEFVSDPTDEEVEWIELYNNFDHEIDLTGWNIEEGSGAKTLLKGIIGKNKFFIIEKPNGNLNNKGDAIILSDNKGKLIDQVIYGAWDDGNISNNAPMANDPYSVGRKFDGYNTYNNINDFNITTTPTKGSSNIITKIISEDDNNKIYDYSKNIIISEILPNPKGSDSENEFIELYNNSEQEIDLTGWVLRDESNSKGYKFNKKINKIKPGEYLAIFRKESKIALNNNADSVKLYQPLKDDPLRSVSYKKAEEGWSYVNTQIAMNEEWVWSEIATPGKLNIIKTVNRPPVVDFDYPDEILVGAPVIFDSSDTIDEDGDNLKFEWDFGDNIKSNLSSPEHTFFKIGKYIVKLTVSDGKNKVEKKKTIEVIKQKIQESDAQLKMEFSNNEQTKIIINEILPNPEGPDAEEEWIELKNIGDKRINLLNWKLNDISKNSKQYVFDSDIWIDVNGFLVVSRVDSKVTLNNTFDTVRLFNNFNEIVDEIEYQGAPKGKSYAKKQNKKWFWTTILTPGSENIFSDQVSKIANSKTSQKNKKNNKSKKSIAHTIETTLSKIKEFESGDLIKVKGTVAVKPNVFGSQYFYIVGSPGIQVYSYKKEFPALRVGDYVEVSGELSVNRGEQKLKIKQSDNIKILEHRKEPIAEEVSNEKINEDYVGRFVAVSGEITGRNGSTVYLDDSLDEIQIYIKKLTNINPKSMKVGKTVKIIGIVGKTNSGVKIMPRSSDDIIKITNKEDDANKMPGNIETNDEWAMAKRNKKLELLKYLLVFAGGIVIVLAWMLIKLRKEEK